MFGKKLSSEDVYNDTMDSGLTSIYGNRYGQVFTTKDFFVDIYPMKSKVDCGQALHEFIADNGVMLRLTFDGLKEQIKPGTKFMKTITKYDVDYHVSEPEQSNQNAAKSVMRELHKKWFQKMVRKRVPRIL